MMVTGLRMTNMTKGGGFSNDGNPSEVYATGETRQSVISSNANN